MEKITYRTTAIQPFCIQVVLGGKHVGDILQAKKATGYFYKPLRSKAGPIMGSVREVKASLEG